MLSNYFHHLAFFPNNLFDEDLASILKAYMSTFKNAELFFVRVLNVFAFNIYSGSEGDIVVALGRVLRLNRCLEHKRLSEVGEGDWHWIQHSHCPVTCYV